MCGGLSDLSSNQSMIAQYPFIVLLKKDVSNEEWVCSTLWELETNQRFQVSACTLATTSRENSILLLYLQSSPLA